MKPKTEHPVTAPPRPGNPATRQSDHFGYRPNRRFQFTSLNQRVYVLIALMITMVLTPAILSIILSAQADTTVQSMRQGAAQAVQISDLQIKWLAVVGTLEGLAPSTITETQFQLDSRLADLERSLNSLATSDLGLTPETIASNRALSSELQLIGEQMRDLSAELYNLSVSNRWSQAQNRRQAGLSELQGRLDVILRQLNRSLQADIDARSAQLTQQSRRTSTTAGVVGLVAMFFAGVWIVIARRAIVGPLARITADVKRITGGDFTPPIALQRSDEIGTLSQSIVLMTEWLRESYETLEQRVAQRTQEVERRRVEIQVAAQVARDIAATHNLESLLNQAVNLIRDRFGFYHAGIFLQDDAREYAVLRAATGNAGRELLARNHRLRVGQIGLVGFAAQAGEARIADDVSLDEAHYKNPLLPDTRSEVAIPLKTAGRVIGVLDVQSTQPKAFDAENLEVLQVLADQLATAIQNARLLQTVQRNLEELQSAYGQVERQAWQRFIHNSPLIGYEYDGLQANPITRSAAPSAADGETPADDASREDPSRSEDPSRPEDLSRSEDLSRPSLHIPLYVRGVTIGALDVWGKDGALGETEQSLLSNLGGRLSQIIESARLFEQAQTRAMRERTINRLTASIARSLDTDGVLRSAALQLGDLPNVLEASVVLGTIGESEELSRREDLSRREELSRRQPGPGASERRGTAPSAASGGDNA